MRKILLFTIIYTFLGCKNHKKNYNSLDQIQNSNFRIFEGVYIKTSNTLKGKKRVSSFIKEYDGEKYLLPNFNYYNCIYGDTICLKAGRNNTFDVSKYSLAMKEKNSQDYNSSLKTIYSIVNEFEKSEFYKIYSSSEIGNSILFFIKDDEYIAYISDFSKVKNRYWLKELLKAEKIDKHWYRSKIESP